MLLDLMKRLNVMLHSEENPEITDTDDPFIFETDGDGYEAINFQGIQVLDSSELPDSPCILAGKVMLDLLSEIENEILSLKMSTDAALWAVQALKTKEVAN